MICAYATPDRRSLTGANIRRALDKSDEVDLMIVAIVSDMQFSA